MLITLWTPPAKSSLAKWNSSQVYVAILSDFKIQVQRLTSFADKEMVSKPRSTGWEQRLLSQHDQPWQHSIHSPTQAVQWANLQVTRLPLSVASFARRTCQAHSTASNNTSRETALKLTAVIAHQNKTYSASGFWSDGLTLTVFVVRFVPCFVQQEHPTRNIHLSL